MGIMTENPDTRIHYSLKLNSLSSSSSVTETSTDQQQAQEIPKLRTHKFPTYLDAPAVSSTARTFCEILTRASPHEVESALSRTGLIPAPEVVQEVLKLSYESPSSAIKFFRWSSCSQKHSAYTWNLMVDLLGKNQLFDPMWDAIRSMRQEGVLSTAAFVSVFSSYCMGHRFNEAVMSFDVMHKYGIQQDIIAVNALLSAICLEDNQTSRAFEVLDKIKEKILPDGDSFTILFEGWEKEGNLVKAKSTFDEMIECLGWNKLHMSAYSASLMMLFRGSQADEAIKLLQVMKDNNCLPELKFFSNALDILVKQSDSTHVVLMWDIMVGSGLLPNLVMYNAVIGLLCNNKDIQKMFQFLDDMVLHGAFPNSLTYNMIFQCLVKNKRVRQLHKFLCEMIKNEAPPTHDNCAAAITMALEEDDPEMAIDIWNYMVENQVSPLEQSANALLIGLCNLCRLTVLARFVEDMVNREVDIYESTIAKLKNAFYKEGRSTKDRFDSLLRRRKTSSGNNVLH